MAQNGYWFNDNGEIVKSNVYIIYGSPASGKTTYVKKHMAYGDLVVDLDLIKQSLSMSNKTETPDNLLSVALSVREHLYQLIVSKQFHCKNVWVVASLPLAQERNELKERLDAQLVFVEASEEDCIKRAMADDERVDKDKQIAVIRKWFKKYYRD
jgi:predicted kinase